MENNLNVAWCPFCDQGWVQIVKDSGNGQLLLECDECYTTWEKSENVIFGHPTRYTFQAVSTVPSIEEIQKMGWADDIINDW